MTTPALQFDWEQVTHRPISALVGQNERAMSDGSTAWDALAFCVGDHAVVLTVNPDTDEIIVAHETMPEGDGWQPVTLLSHVVGKSFGWSWIGTNHRGYTDSFMLALGEEVPDALEPRLMFLCEASSLTCFDVTIARA